MFYYNLKITYIDTYTFNVKLDSNNIVNSSIIIQYQCRDMYGNNIQD